MWYIKKGYQPNSYGARQTIWCNTIGHASTSKRSSQEEHLRLPTSVSFKLHSFL